MLFAEALEHLRADRPSDALALLRTLVGRQPADAKAWFLLGACQHALNDLVAAHEAFSRSLRLDRGNAEVHLAHISVLRALGDNQGAVAASREALTDLAGDARASYAMALCLEDCGELEDALVHYDAALATSPTYADALHNRGLLLARLGRLEDAQANQRRYVAAHPQDLRAHLALADIQLALGLFEEALMTIEAAERPAPGDVGTVLRRGAALASLRRFEQASECFAKTRALDPSAVAEFLQRIVPGSDPELMLSPENLFFWQCQLAFKRCDWTHWEACAEELRRLPSKPSTLVESAVTFISFHLPVLGSDRTAIAQYVAAGIEVRASVQPPPPPRRPGRIRLGLLSPDLREHLNGYLLLPFFQLLDRERFELYAYSLAPDDGSAIRAQLCGAAEHFRELRSAPDEAAAAIRADDIDILVDAAGHTTGGKFAIPARRPARLQALYLGFAGSLGSRRVDYVILDRIVVGDPSEWTEAPVHLPHTYYLYDFRNSVPDIAVARREYGLREDDFVFCAFHKAEKISPDAFELWMSILARLPRSVLWLLSLPVAAQQNLRRQAASRGVNPSRLIFAPFDRRDRYLARQGLGDLMLDTIHHSAMTTACDAMAAGLPVLTMPGKAMTSRAGESLARAAGVSEMAASGRQAYIEKAIALASNPAELQQIRRKLLARTAPLFDTLGRVRELEAAFQGMYDRMMRGEPPAPFDVQV